MSDQAITNILNNNQPQRRRRRRFKGRKTNKPKIVIKIPPSVKPKVNKILKPAYPIFRPEYNYKGMKSRGAKRFAQSMMYQRDLSELEYAASILEPEIPVVTGKLIKQPSLVPIPSTTTTFKNSYDLKTDSNGDLYLNWIPNFLTTAEALSQYTTTSGNNPYNIYTHINLPSQNTAGTAVNNLKGLKCYLPTISLAKYRLVSAKIRITYIGTAMENCGYIAGSISYDQPIVGVGYAAVNDQSYNYINASGSTVSKTTHDAIFNIIYNNFDLNKILNGLWPISKSFTGNGSGLSAVYIPTDPTDEIFYKLNTLYGDTPMYSLSTGGFVPITSQEGAHSNYYFTAHGMKPDTESIRVETFYNFEIVPTAQSAPFLRVTSENPKGVNMTRVKERVKRFVDAGIGGRPRSNSIDISRKISDLYTNYSTATGLRNPSAMNKAKLSTFLSSLFSPLGLLK